MIVEVVEEESKKEKMRKDGGEEDKNIDKLVKKELE